MPQSLVTLAYLAAGLLFIFSLGGLSAQGTARRGNTLGIIGMAIAIVNLGPTRADELAAAKLEGRLGDVLPRLADTLIEAA